MHWYGHSNIRKRRRSKKRNDNDNNARKNVDPFIKKIQDPYVDWIVYDKMNC
jgi:hypothetical protein